MHFFLANSEPTPPNWLQYGSFGLLSFLIVAGVPAAAAYLQRWFRALAQQQGKIAEGQRLDHQRETASMRDWYASEREADRKAIADLSRALDRLGSAVARLDGRRHRPGKDRPSESG